MVIICLRKISNINRREILDPVVTDNKKNFVKKIFQFFDFYLVEKKIEKKISILKNIIVVLIFFDRFDRQFSRNSLKNYFSDEPKWMINYILEILQTNTINNYFTDLTDYFYYKECDIYWRASSSENNTNYNYNFNNINTQNIYSNNIAFSQNDIGDSTLDNITNISNNLQNSFSNPNISSIAKENTNIVLLDSISLETYEPYKSYSEVDKINNLIYEKYEPQISQNEITAFNTTQTNIPMNVYSYWSTYSNNLSVMKDPLKFCLLDCNHDYTKIYEEFIKKIGEPKSYLSVYKHIIIKEVIVFIQIYFLGYEKIPKINIPYSTLINHFYRVVENSNTSIDFEILIAFIRIIKKYGEQITDEWSDIFKILNIIIRREENKNFDKLIKVLYEILDRIKLLIISQKFNGVLSEYINFLDEFKTFPYDSLMILKCKYKLNTFLNYVSKLESVIIDYLLK